MCVIEPNEESPAEQALRIMEGTGDDRYAIIQLCELLLKVTDVECVEVGALEGIHRVIGLIKKHGEAVCDAHELAERLVKSCA